MSGMQDAMKRAGLSGGSTERKCEKCGRSFVARDPSHRTCGECFQKGRRATSHRRNASEPCEFPSGYPEYFDADGILKCEYVTALAEKIAVCLGTGSPALNMHQLRAFYGQVKRLHAALKSGREFKQIYPEICKLKAFARERAEKDKISVYFQQFICRNVDQVRDRKAFLEGFVEHFQAVVAYCAGTIKER